MVENTLKLLVVPFISGLWPISPIQTTCLMAIHRPGGRKVVRVAKLDTAASQNLISRRLVSSMGLQVQEYFGPLLQPVGPLIPPGGMVSLEWHVSGKQVDYETAFAVLEEHHCHGLDFDILLCEDEIKKIGFFIKNNAVFYIQ